MMRRVFTALSLTLVAAGSVAAAPSATVKVGGNGRLELPPAVVKKLGIQQKRGELVCVQFPRPPAGKHVDDGHGHPASTRPPRIYTGLGNDGRLTVAKSPGETATGTIPGKPGTVYRATNTGGVLVLTLVK